MSYQTGDGMLLLPEVTEAALADGPHRQLWEHLIPLLPQCVGYPCRCDNIATHTRCIHPQDPVEYACAECFQNEEAGPVEEWEALPWIAHVVTYRLLLRRQPKGRPQ